MFRPAAEEETLALTWCSNVGRACCSTATEQVSALLNGSVGSPERNNQRFALFLPSCLPFFHSPQLPASPVQYKTNATAVRKCAGAGSVFCQFLLTSEPLQG